MLATSSFKHFSATVVGAALLVALSFGSAPALGQKLPDADPVDSLLEPTPEDDPGPDALAPRRGGPPEGRGFGARADGRGPERGIWRRLSDEEREELYAFVEENFPELYQELEEIRQDEVRLFHRRMARLAPKLLELLDLMDADPERGKLAVKEHKLEIELRGLLLQYHKSQDQQHRAELRAQIKPVVVRKLECRRERHEQEIRDLEARIARLRSRLEMSATKQDELVEKLLERLLNTPPPEDEPAERGRRGGRGRHGRLGPPAPPGSDESEPPVED